MPTPLPIYPDVDKYQNGQRLDAETMNTPIGQLERRTDWLYSRLGEFIGSQNRASVRVSNVELGPGAKVGDCVYFDPVSGLFCKALAKTLIESSPFYVSSATSLVVGMLSEVHSSDGNAHAFGTVVLSGLLDFDSLADVQALVESGIEFKSGPYYLSSVEPGKITPNPSGPAIYVGMFFSDSAPGENPDSPQVQTSSIPSTAKHGTYALLAPQYKDLAEMHHHRAFVLSGAVHGDGVCSFDPYGDRPDRLMKLYVSGTYTGTKTRIYEVSFVYSDDGTTFSPDPTGITDSWEQGRAYAKCKDLVDNVTTYHQIHVSEAAHNIILRPNTYYGLEFSIGKYGLTGYVTGYTYPLDAAYAISFPSFTTDAIKGWNPVFQKDIADNHDLIIRIPVEDIANADGSYEDDDDTVFFKLKYRYKYEVGLNSDLATFFPPFPINGTAFVMNGNEYNSVNLWGEERGAYLVTDTAIYWKGEDQLTDAAFYLTRGSFPSSSFVTSIKAAKDSGIKIRQEGTTDVASTGNLVIDAQIPIEKSNPGLAGYMVPKDVVNNKLIFGPVVSSISVGAGLSIASRQAPGEGYGDVHIDLSSNFNGGSFDDIVLHNAKQELVGAFPYVKLLGSSDVASGFTMKMHVPIMTPPLENGYSLLFFMSVFGLSNSTDENMAAGINIQASVLHDWYPDCPETGANTWPFKGTLDSITPLGDITDVYAIPLGSPSSSEYPQTTGVYYKAFDPIFVHNDKMFADRMGSEQPLKHYLLKLYPTESGSDGKFTIDGLQPNSSVAITIRRAVVAGAQASTNYTNYSGEIGFMNMSWRLVPTTTA